jgi:N-acyl-D-amino-acid deacylase
MTDSILIRNGMVIDGTGRPGILADVAIAGDRILAIGAAASSERGGREIDATGLVVAPGFIDAHTHDDCALLSIPEMTPKVSQGVTTVITGNCGVSLAPVVIEGQPPAPLDLLGYEPGWFRFDRFGGYVDALTDQPPSLNGGLLVGHITLRHRVMDRFDRAATKAEVAEMKRQVGLASWRRRSTRRCSSGARPRSRSPSRITSAPAATISARDR